MNEVVIIGGGAAGMMAGIVLAGKGYKPTIIEKNDKLGRKLFITGKGRCNLTNSCDDEVFYNNVVTNPKFMYSAYSGFNTEAAMDFFESLGLKLKVERGGRVFPLSDHSSDVISVLNTKLKRLGVDVILNSTVTDIYTEEYSDDTGKQDRIVTGVEYVGSDKKKQVIKTDYVVVATGGVSYPLTGSTGDGIRWAEDMGLKTVTPKPGLVPMEVKEDFCYELMGLSLKNVNVSFVARVKNKDKQLYSAFGEMLFTHFGVSGPVILSASSYLNKYLDSDLRLFIDLKPALTREQLDDRILRDFSGNINKQFRNSLDELLPKKLIPVIINLAGIDPYKKVNEVTKAERMKLLDTIKGLELNITGFRGFNEAIITQGGVSVKEINPSNMESKHIKGLRFIGEVLDVDALTGGFNLQIAWSTAWALD